MRALSAVIFALPFGLVLSGCSGSTGVASNTTSGPAASAASASSTGTSTGGSTGSAATTTGSNASSGPTGTTGLAATSTGASEGTTSSSIGTTGARASTGAASAGNSSGSGTTSSGTSSGGTTGGGCGTCPSDYTCGSANGLPVCRAPSGIPQFTHVFVILMENLSLSTLQGDGGYPNTPYLKSLVASGATSTNYSGVSHPSLPNYLALTSGETVTSIGCDCQPTGSACNPISCSVLTSSCGCPQSTPCIADDLEDGGLTWHNYAEGMGTPCNVGTDGGYAPKHVPFLYYPQVQTNATRCDANVIDYASHFPSDLSGSTVPSFSFISPNLTDDMHDPAFPSNGPQNQVNGDTWLAAQVPAILSSGAYQNGGLLVIVWDEDDDDGIFGNNPIPMFLLSPYANAQGYQSTVAANHYNLLATFEDGLGLPRLGNAVGLAPLVDFFPNH